MCAGLESAKYQTAAEVIADVSLQPTRAAETPAQLISHRAAAADPTVF